MPMLDADAVEADSDGDVEREVGLACPCPGGYTYASVTPSSRLNEEQENPYATQARRWRQANSEREMEMEVGGKAGRSD